MSETAHCLIYRDTSGAIRALVMADAPLAVQTAREAARSGWSCTAHDLEAARAIARAGGTWYTQRARPHTQQPALF